MAHGWSHGNFYWNELMTRDAEKAKKFYGGAIGWTFEAMAKPADTYWVAKNRRRLCRRIVCAHQPAVPIFDIPGVDRIAVLTEPGGAGIGWMTPIKA